MTDRILQWLVQDAAQRIRIAREQPPCAAATALERQGITVARHAWVLLSMINQPDPKHVHAMPESDEQLEAWLGDQESRFNRHPAPPIHVQYR